jgi:CheY-like chemotaxis protein
MEAVGRLTGGVAHDFNNLLTIVLGNLELVRERVAGDPKMMRQIDSALSAGRRGADLTHRLLAFSRRQPLEPVSVDTNKRIAELVPLLSRTIGETIQVKQHIVGAPLWRVVVDPGQFESSIMNLAVNARDAMPGGGVLGITSENQVVDLDYAAQHPGLVTGNYVRISVSDTGIGMSPEVVAQAFEPFFTTKEVGKGTGLGLSMIYGFVKQSGGHATIYSEVGVGTTVTLLLPADPSDREQIAQRVQIVVPKTGTEKILVVEDDPEVLNVTISFLDALGYQTLQAGSVREGFDLFKANPDIGMILTDVILPGGEDGADFARQARALRPDAKVLFMSGYTEDVVMHNGRLDAGVVLLRKPFTQAQLAEKVRAVIDAAPPLAAE